MIFENIYISQWQYKFIKRQINVYKYLKFDIQKQKIQLTIVNNERNNGVRLILHRLALTQTCIMTDAGYCTGSLNNVFGNFPGRTRSGAPSQKRRFIFGPCKAFRR